ncbi:oxidoreductase [Leptospira sp. 'Mane']|uniref:oxidoreductase n=1 Tax=Leptospira sp. 'Mane' TaxID=3387407 RepID=UPI00398B9EA1
MMNKVWLITGSSRGLGRSLAESVLEKGDIVVATARKPEQLKDLKTKFGDRILTLKLDVTDPNEVKSVVTEVISQLGRIDVLVNNAGYGFFGAVEEQSEADIRSQIETNLFGVIYVTKEVLPYMRKARSGSILQVSSVGGRGAVPGISAYHAAKFGVEGFSESLAQEILPLGIKLTIIEPGGFATDWAGSSMDYATPISDYAETLGLLKTYLQKNTPPGDPKKAALAMIQVVESENPPLRLALGKDAVELIRRGEKSKSEELEKWLSLSLSTDRDGSLTVFDTDTAKLFK